MRKIKTIRNIDLKILKQVQDDSGPACHYAVTLLVIPNLFRNLYYFSLDYYKTIDKFENLIKNSQGRNLNMGKYILFHYLNFYTTIKLKIRRRKWLFFHSGQEILEMAIIIEEEKKHIQNLSKIKSELQQ